jgi:hypothetical protein
MELQEFNLCRSMFVQCLKVTQLHGINTESVVDMHGLVQPKRFPRAMFLTFTIGILLLMLAPVFFTNWEILDLTGCLGLRWKGLGVSDLESRVLDKNCVDLLSRG